MYMKWRLIGLACVALACSSTGCIHQTTYVGTYRIHRHLSELREAGQAEVDGHVLSLDSEVGFRGRPMPVSRLVADCPLIPPVGRARRRMRRACRLLRVRRVTLGERVNWRASASLWGGATLAMVAAGVVLGVLIAGDRSDSPCDIDCPP